MKHKNRKWRKKKNIEKSKVNIYEYIVVFGISCGRAAETGWFCFKVYELVGIVVCLAAAHRTFSECVKILFLATSTHCHVARIVSFTRFLLR